MDEGEFRGPVNGEVGRRAKGEVDVGGEGGVVWEEA